MTAAEKSGNRFLRKLVLYSVKMIPILISGIYVLNTALSYFGIDWEGFSYLVQLMFISFLYMTSYTFRFCAWHRMFIHYILPLFFRVAFAAININYA